MAFPKGFVWGAATAAYQIEGAAHEDGKGPSVWDEFCRRRGAIWMGQRGDVACDHYHRYKEDVALWKRLGLKAYRFSIGWPRVLPEGVGRSNPKGWAFYDRLVDELLAAGIAPYITLFHWDYPYALYARGGWLNRDSASWFAEYASLAAAKLGDRVGHWINMNEPQCFIGLGHVEGGPHAPGDKHSLHEVLTACHHTLLAHGRGVQALRASLPRTCQVGIAPVGSARIPVTDSAKDVAAARADMFATGERPASSHPWWLDPIFLGHYPADGVESAGSEMPEIGPRDMQTIRQPLDFLGINTYWGDIVRALAGGRREILPMPGDARLSAYKWPLRPEALYWAPKFFQERYKVPLYITENGMSGTDWVALDGKVHDPARIDFTARYLGALGRAIKEGVDVRGYFHWSIMDNFEWAEGFKERFGLIYVDFATQKRTPKDSAYWYKKVIATNGRTLG